MALMLLQIILDPFVNLKRSLKRSGRLRTARFGMNVAEPLRQRISEFLMKSLETLVFDGSFSRVVALNSPVSMGFVF